MARLRRACVLGWGGAAVSWQLWHPAPEELRARLVGCAAFLLLAAGAALYIRQCLLAELRRTREIAGAAQRALLRPLPARLEGLAFAAAPLAAGREAVVGGDLYEAVATPYGVRVVIGDVRGHGPTALGAAAALLGSFREAAYDEPEPDGVLRRMERALERHLVERARGERAAGRGEAAEGAAAEEFATLLLLEISEDGTVRALNCGHPAPHRLRAAGGVRAGRGGSAVGTAELLTLGEPLPPLGVWPLPEGVEAHRCGRLLPGESLVLHTDGVAEARDAAGGYFPLRGALAEAAGGAAAPSPAGLVAEVRAALLRHTGGRLADDAALLVVRNDRRAPPASPSGQAVCRAASPGGT
ncbi:PP2C family protein-serine/threonine phosphatase [Streptomyces sp. NPDC097619]|uniref:PP2C family protein-serine/threonine phosphatase n=1 Tax=Streptomyces sp. NPDC097619 TaxID=3157228 RepID=UPI003334729A